MEWFIVELEEESDGPKLLLSLCETAKLQNVEPGAHLLKAAYAAIENPGAIVLPSELIADPAA